MKIRTCVSLVTLLVAVCILCAVLPVSAAYPEKKSGLVREPCENSLIYEYMEAPSRVYIAEIGAENKGELIESIILLLAFLTITATLVILIIKRVKEKKRK